MKANNSNRQWRARGERPHGAAQNDWMAPDRRGGQGTNATERSEIRAWFMGNLTDHWFIGDPDITVDDYEILVVGALAPMDLDKEDGDSRAVAIAARLDRFREDTRERRMTIAADAQVRFERKVSWGASVNGTPKLFTTANVPVMTRLRIEQRRLLDTLVDANVARSRSEALMWCVDLVAKHEGDWIASLRSALDTVTRAREGGPDLARDV